MKLTQSMKDKIRNFKHKQDIEIELYGYGVYIIKIYNIFHLYEIMPDSDPLYYSFYHIHYLDAMFNKIEEFA